jgi:hypothetical protein
MDRTYKGSCFCGAVAIVVTGDPVAMGYCHCDSCRRWSGSPVSAYSLWRPGAVKLTAGAENVGTFSKTPKSARKWCKTCGGHLLTEHPALRLVDVFPSVVPELDFRPREHVHYQEAVLRVTDALPKHKDLPKSSGGSGVLIPS